MNATAITRRRSTLGDWFVPPILALGGLVLPLIGWLIACYFLWRSPTWTYREKLIGTFVVPGGAWTLAAVALLVATTSTSTEPAPTNTAGIALLVAIVVAQALSLAVLWRRTWIQR